MREDKIGIIKPFAAKYEVKLHTNENKPDKWGIWHGDEAVVAGKYGEIADDYGDGKLRMRITAVPRSNGKMNKSLNSRAEQARAAGMELHQKNGYETIWLFKPSNVEHCKLAVELIRPQVRRKRVLTDEQRAVLVARMAAMQAKRRQAVQTSV